MSGVATAGQTLEGRVVIELPQGAPARVALTGPGDIGGLLHGRRPEEALAVVPLVYALCGTAQSHAAVSALEGACGIVPTAATRAARAALSGMETLREHCLRISLDWPGLLDLPPAVVDLRPVMDLLPGLTAALFGRQRPFDLGADAVPDRAAALDVIEAAEDLLARDIFAEPLAAWRARRGWDDLQTWAQGSGTLAGRVLAAVVEAAGRDAGAVEARPLKTPSPAALRTWLQTGSGLPLESGPLQNGLMAEGPVRPETTPFSRNLDDPLLASLASCGLTARLAARLVELARLPAALRRLVTGGMPPPAAPCGAGFGCAVVEAARGLLIHAVQLHDGAVARYRILPPTRWNFDAAGLAQRSLSGLAAAEEAVHRRQAEMVVMAIDPCVRHEVRFS